MSNNTIQQNVADDALTTAVHTLIKGQMIDVLLKAKADLSNDAACARLLAESGFGSASIAELGTQARTQATTATRPAQPPTPRSPCRIAPAPQARRAAQ